MSKAVTILDIAREAGVSPATVSRVLNDSAPVAEATRKRVLAAAEAHHYAPNPFARGLVSNLSRTLGVLIPDITNPYFSLLFREVETAARQAGYSVLLYNSSFSAADASDLTEQELEGFRRMLEQRVDGVLVIGGQADLLHVTEAYREGLSRLAAQVPVVVLGDPIREVPCRFIQRERGHGVLLALQHLTSLGHRRIAFVGGEAEVGITEARLAAYVDGLSLLGLPLDRSLISLSDYYAPAGYRAMKALLASRAPFTAFLAMNDHVALGAIRALADAGLRVPEDVSCVSCDRFLTADYCIPRLTSVDQHNERFGRALVEALLEEIQGKPTGAPRLVSPELILRESCQPVASP